MNRIVKIVSIVFLVAAIAGGSFYGGMLYGDSRSQATLPQLEGATGEWVPAGEGTPAGMPGARGQRAQGGGQGGMLSGQIMSIADGELTIEDSSGQKRTVHVTDTTLIQKQADVAVTDLEEGETVVVSGSEGTDGSITARLVQVSSFGGLGIPGDLPFGAGQPGPATGGTTP